ncbi:phenylalanine--tRNA ligase subunit beta [Auritidibacter ignavus]|uniref:phenylalanine--tRNA ligase subunit beta n=1 Tax=Auritidibacter ignavus TaxID=678932 RepID=UPI00109D81C4|nr:phenylalanine--tRNA ligase subunit beta [Auritidibacter ignavus]
MRIPLSWLREFTQLPAGATAEDLMADLVSVGLEEEDVHRPLDELSGPIVVGKVLDKTPEEHSNGKTVNWCHVQVVPDGASQTLEGEGIAVDGVQGVICGAHNFEPGDKVVVTLPGAVLPGDFRISARKTYGHISAGMIASEKELGLGEGHEGIIVLGDWGLDPEPGTDVIELLGLDDEAAEINVTADRSYVLSLRGVAREYGHATGTTSIDPAESVHPPVPNDSGYPVVLDDQAPIHGNPGATRFVTRTVTGVDTTGATPVWMAQRLRLAGIRSLSLPVDISNYVMLEMGQPLHFYDRDRLNGALRVRRAASGETLETLDGKTRTLDPEDLLIADDSGSIGLAGVMGGLATEVTEQTTDIVIESAHFDQVSVARTKRRHKLPSEASRRNERGVDWEICDEAAERAVQLLVELAGGVADEGVTDIGERPEPTVVEMAADFPTQRIGYEFTTEQIDEVLEQIGCKVTQHSDEQSGTTYRVTVPSWRFDLTIAEDLTEEIARLVGYDKIPSRLPVAPAGRGFTPRQRLRRNVSETLAASGLVEVLSYPFVAESDNRFFGSADEQVGAQQQMVHLANPLSAELGWLRTSMLPGLVTTLHRNISRGFKDVALFETGLVFHPEASSDAVSEIPGVGVHPAPEVLERIVNSVPHQPHYVAAVFAGHAATPGPGFEPTPYDWEDAIGTALNIADAVGVALEVRQGAHQAFHPGRCAELVTASGSVLGYAGELLPKYVQQQHLPERVAAVELDLDRLLDEVPEVVEARAVSPYPAVTQDVALVVDEAMPAAQVKRVLEEAAGELLEEIALFDVYRGARVEHGKKSLAFNLRFRDHHKTLTNDEASEVRLAAVARAEQELGAHLR